MVDLDWNEILLSGDVVHTWAVSAKRVSTSNPPPNSAGTQSWIIAKRVFYTLINTTYGQKVAIPDIAKCAP